MQKRWFVLTMLTVISLLVIGVTISIRHDPPPQTSIERQILDAARGNMRTDGPAQGRFLSLEGQERK